MNLANALLLSTFATGLLDKREFLVKDRYSIIAKNFGAVLDGVVKS